MARIGLDIDNTAAQYSASLHNKARIMGLVDGDFSVPTTYNMLEEGWFSDKNHFLQAHKELCSETGLATLDPYEGSLNDIVQQWQEDGHEVVVITARLMADHDDDLRRKVIDGTHQWVKNHIPTVDDIFIVEGGPGTKLVAEADVYIDDSPSVINDLRENGKKVIIRHQPYNSHLDGDRVEDLSDISF